MKRWLLYYFAVFLVVAICPVVSAELDIANNIPIITVFENGEVCELSVEEYTYRALLREGSFLTEQEARKALAVAIRSEAVYLSIYGCKHEDFDVCTDRKCCIELGREEDFDEPYLENTKSAVDATFGLCMAQGKDIAMALFTQCSGGGTGQCEEFEYLVGVKSNERCELHKTERVFPSSVFETLKDACLVYDEFGKCSFGVFGGEYFSRDELLEELFLPSAEFELAVIENDIKAVSYGIGHSFGLCVCGSEKMARSGERYENILTYYYPNLNINKFYFN